MSALPTPSAEHHCPLCGCPNDCAPARSGSFDTPCWCTTAAFDPSVLERIPEPLRGRACLCRRCAAGDTPAAPAATG